MLSVTAFFLYFSKSISFTVDIVGQLQSISDGTTLVSREGKFEFGFFSPGNSKDRYVGIWFKKIPVQTVVWVANRCNPINYSSGLLMINNKGNLVLLYQNKSVVWSTSSSKEAKKPLVQLLDSGNLVLIDEEGGNSESYLWQSFDYPSDTALPGMKIGWDLRIGLNRRLMAWKNWDDPCPGDLSWEIRFNDAQHHRNPETYLMKGKVKYFRASPWNGLGFGGYPNLTATQPFNYQVADNEEEVYSMYNVTNNSLISMMVLNQTSATRQRFNWMDQSWRLYSAVPKDNCDTYGRCGANGYCAKYENPLCQCLKGFKPKSPENWNLRDWSQGCAREILLNCEDKDREKDGAKCLSNCSCVAYANFDISGKGSGCIIWFGDLMDVRTIPPPSQDLTSSKDRIMENDTSRDLSKENMELPLFELSTIILATNNFSASNKLGQGGFGPVYRGKLEDGQEIAVKRLSSSSGQGIEQFKNEVSLIAKLQHRNLAWTLVQHGRGIELLDSCLRNSHHDFQEVLRCIHVGLLCVQQSAADRPVMSSVILMLGSDSHVLPQPKRPGYFMEEPPPGCPVSSLTNDMTISVLEAR
ncbi:hypothetical protein TIFTF001_032089 [Ficus carica]|uniref:Uncharacterized protein n=1 Tax=Ficus carica TaxID=3494 RepID=A0AA88J694_FICCA|nr:hypothetical protein TIFTF001_032089 [Ficus carica]